MPRILSILFFLAHVGFALPLWAQSAPESNANLASSPLGSISFYLDKKTPATQGQSVHVEEGSKVYFCLQLNSNVPDLQVAARRLLQVDMTLLGEGELPQKIRGSSKLKQDLIYADEQGCWTGRMLVPMATPAGKYRVSELDLRLASGHEISLRDHVSQFQPLGLVEVSSPILDATPPVIERIQSWVPLIDEMNMRHKRAWRNIFFRVTATDEMVGIDPNSFQIFFKVYVDDELIDIMRPLCRATLPNLYYDCTLYFSRAEHDFYGRTLRLSLDSIGVADKHGNWAELTTPEQLEKIFNGKPMEYIFYTHKLPHPTESQKAAIDNGFTPPVSKPKSLYINKLRDNTPLQ